MTRIRKRFPHRTYGPMQGNSSPLRRRGLDPIKLIGDLITAPTGPYTGPTLHTRYTRSSRAVHYRTLAHSVTLPTFQVADDFALPAATALFSLQFTAPLLAAEHFRLLALRCGTACHWRLHRHRLWRPSALVSRRSSLLSHFLTFDSSDIFVSTHSL